MTEATMKPKPAKAAAPVIPLFEMPKFAMPGFEMPKFDISNFDLPKIEVWRAELRRRNGFAGLWVHPRDLHRAALPTVVQTRGSSSPSTQTE